MNTLDVLREDHGKATAALLAIVPEREKWTATSLRNTVSARTGLPSVAVQIALCNLANPEHDGRLVLDEHLEVSATQ